MERLGRRPPPDPFRCRFLPSFAPLPFTLVRLQLTMSDHERHRGRGRDERRRSPSGERRRRSPSGERRRRSLSGDRHRRSRSRDSGSSRDSTSGHRHRHRRHGHRHGRRHRRRHHSRSRSSSTNRQPQLPPPARSALQAPASAWDARIESASYVISELLRQMPHLRSSVATVLGAVDAGQCVSVAKIENAFARTAFTALFSSLNFDCTDAGWARVADCPRLCGEGGVLLTALGSGIRSGHAAATAELSVVAPRPAPAAGPAPLRALGRDDSESEDDTTGPKLAEDPTRRVDRVNLDAVAIQRSTMVRGAAGGARESWMLQAAGAEDALGLGSSGEARAGPRMFSSADDAPARSYGFSMNVASSSTAAVPRSAAALAAEEAARASFSAVRERERSLVEEVAALAAVTAAAARGAGATRAAPAAWNRERDMAVDMKPSGKAPHRTDAAAMALRDSSGLGDRFSKGTYQTAFM